jgi:hypothetical protein
MDDMPLKPYLRATEGEISLTLQQVEMGGAVQFRVDTTLAVAEALPKGWRQLEKVELQKTVKRIWPAIMREAIQLSVNPAGLVVYLKRTDETQIVLDHFAWVKMNLMIEDDGVIGCPIRCKQLFKVLGRWRNSDLLVVFAGNARRFEFLNFITGRESEEVKWMQPCSLRATGLA